ncbi:hypothetical protein PVAP13_6NG186500 [Panicum virgatum]|uniref:Transmembrane protein n=1 Tax=Panicum virgatum TaxID=38727 RepID=A0A8T0QYF3_PANVG|nr:hypothetical protein PVAP13_6NG186500 [Panicum virgatum]
MLILQSPGHFLTCGRSDRASLFLFGATDCMRHLSIFYSASTSAAVPLPDATVPCAQIFGVSIFFLGGLFLFSLFFPRFAGAYQSHLLLTNTDPYQTVPLFHFLPQHAALLLLFFQSLRIRPGSYAGFLSFRRRVVRCRRFRRIHHLFSPMDDNTDSEGVRSSNEDKRSKQTSRVNEHTSTSDGGSSRLSVPMNLKECLVCARAPQQQLLIFFSRAYIWP